MGILASAILRRPRAIKTLGGSRNVHPGSGWGCGYLANRLLARIRNLEDARVDYRAKPEPKGGIYSSRIDIGYCTRSSCYSCVRSLGLCWHDADGPGHRHRPIANLAVDGPAAVCLVAGAAATAVSPRRVNSSCCFVVRTHFAPGAVASMSNLW